jgi:hypothetical protein
MTGSKGMLASLDVRISALMSERERAASDLVATALGQCLALTQGARDAYHDLLRARTSFQELATEDEARAAKQNDYFNQAESSIEFVDPETRARNEERNAVVRQLQERALRELEEVAEIERLVLGDLTSNLEKSLDELITNLDPDVWLAILDELINKLASGLAGFLPSPVAVPLALLQAAHNIQSRQAKAFNAADAWAVRQERYNKGVALWTAVAQSAVRGLDEKLEQRRETAQRWRESWAEYQELAKASREDPNDLDVRLKLISWRPPRPA